MQGDNRTLFFFTPGPMHFATIRTLLSRDYYGLVRSTKISINILVGFGQCVLRNGLHVLRTVHYIFIKYIQST